MYIVLLLICICIFFLFILLTTTKNNEQFCEFQADAGLICPFKIQQNGFNIVPYDGTPDIIQKQVEEHMHNQWNYGKEFIQKQWPRGSTNVFYVMYKNNEFIGCVAVDRKNFYPYISQLYVAPNKRQNGYSDILLSIAEKYTKAMGFSRARLWCDKDLVQYFQKMKWKIDEEKDDTFMMSKHIIHVSQFSLS